MIKIENIDIWGFKGAIRGMRNPMNSWDRSDSIFSIDKDCIGENDLDLMRRLFNSGAPHQKYLRMIHAQMDITAPLYWWKEFDTYKIGTVANSCSTMHKIHSRELTLDDFSCEHLIFEETVPDEEFQFTENWEELNDKYCGVVNTDFVEFNTFPGECLKYAIEFLNRARELYLKTRDKKYWWQMIQLLPSSYNQKRTIDMDYEVIFRIISQREGHKLDEWNIFVEQLKTLPYIKELLENDG